MTTNDGLARSSSCDLEYCSLVVAKLSGLIALLPAARSQAI